MRKNFLLLFLMALLPLAGWAASYDVQVTTYNGSAVWCGGKPAVQSGWFTAAIVGGGTPSNAVKTAIAEKLQVKDLADYNVGPHDYQLELKNAAQNTVTDNDENVYTIYLNSSTTATLTITKFTEEGPAFALNQLQYVADVLTYSNEPKTLLTLANEEGAKAITATVNGAAVPVVYALSETAETWTEDYASLTGTDAGTYTVYYKVAGTDNYTGSAAATAFGEGKTIAQLNQNDAFAAEGAKPTANTWTYDAQAHALFTAPTHPVAFGTYEYSLTGADETWYTSEAIAASEELTAAFKGTSNTGNKTVYWRVASTANYTGFDATALTATIAKATPVLNVDGVFNSDWTVYNGENHNLFKQAATATINNGETPVSVCYSYDYNNSGSWPSGAKTTYNDDAFSVKNAGTYTLRVFVGGTNDLNWANKDQEIVVAQADITGFTNPKAKTGLKATNDAQDLVEYASWGENTELGTFQYKVGEADWSAVAKGTIAGTYSVNFQIVPADAVNYKTYTIAEPLSVTIAAKDKVTITIPANQSFGYGTTPTPEYTATWDNQGTDVLNEEGLTWTWYTGATGDTQAAKVGGYYPAGEYYVMVSGLAVTGQTSASQEIVYPTDRQKVKITAGQIVAKISGTATYGSVPTFTLTHVSGLAPADAEALNTNSTVKTVTVKKGEDVLVNGDPADADIQTALKALNAYDSYTLEATAEYDPNTNYTLLVNPGTLKVNPNAAYGFTIGDIADVEYKAAKWEPAVTVAGLTKDKDYTVTYGGTVGTTTYDNIKAGEGIVIINGIGNYAGATSSKTFTINKAALTITANNRIGDDAWVYGTAEFTDEYPKYTAKVTGLKSDNDYVDGKLAGIADALTVVRTSNETVGMHEGALVAQFGTAQPAASDNYTITYNAGNLQIAKGTVVIKLKEAVDDDTYGDDPDATESIKTAIQNIANYEYVSGLSPLEAANFASIIDVSAATYTLASDQYQVGTNYSFAIDGVTSTNYKVTVPEGGIYKVNPSPIKLKAKDQTIDWSADPNATPNTSVSGETVEVITSGSQPGLRYGDALTDVIESVVIESTKVGEEGNVISLTAKQNANYDIIELQNGKLTITGADIVLMRSVYADADDDEFSTIQSYNGLNKQVKITVNRTYTLPGTSTTYTWKGEDWNAFILPFDITPKELSAVFGYAIVNVVNPAATKDGNIAFKLNMSQVIPANTPFMLKNYQAVEEGAVIDFGVRTIVAPESAEVSVDAGENINFIGSYKTKKLGENMSNLYFYNGEGAWKHLKAATTTSWNIAPFNAYMEMPATGGAREYTFTFEELDGGTTAIRSISEDATGTNAKGWYTLNGVKMQNAPTQKGVYIKDGKKVVIK